MLKSVIVAGLALAAGSAAAGPMFQTASSQGSADGLRVQAIDYVGSIADAYAYAASEFGRQSGGVLSQAQLLQDKANVFIVNSSVDGLGFFVVFDNGLADTANLLGEDQSGTNANNAAGLVSYVPDTFPTGSQTLLVEDDNNDTALQAGTSTSPFAFDFNWARGFTDGLAGTFGGAVGDSVRLDLDSWQGIDGFNVIGADGMGGIANTTGTFGTMDDGATFVQFTAIPMPHPALMASLGLGGLIVGVRRR